MTQFAHADNEESSIWEMGFASREDAIASARENEDYQYEGGFVIGEVRDFNITDYLQSGGWTMLEGIMEHEDLPDHVAERIQEKFIRASMGGRKGPARDAMVELEGAIRDTIAAWWAKHGFKTDWRPIVNIEHYTLSKDGTVSREAL